MSSSSSRSRSRVLFLFPVSLGLLALGCGRSPAIARTPVQMVKIDGTAVPCHCDEDDDEDDLSPPKPQPVQYVRMGDWEPPESVKRIESEISPRGERAPTYLEFPRLSLHRPIGESRVVRIGRPYYWGGALR